MLLKAALGVDDVEDDDDVEDGVEILDVGEIDVEEDLDNNLGSVVS